MFEIKSSARQVKEAYLLAEQMRGDSSNVDEFREKLLRQRKQNAALTDHELDRGIQDHQRRARFNAGVWALRVVPLTSCSVWPHMGNRTWTSGPVPKVAADLPRRHDERNKIWRILPVAHWVFGELPLIVLAQNQNDAQFRIEDGCHRAVAYYLAGFHHAFAYVGKVPDELNHRWRWEGEP